MSTQMRITKNKIAIDFPMTRERYLSTWKVFRSISDENYITAKHLLSLGGWDDIVSILDIGCGDGLIAKSIVLNSPRQIDKVILVDPDKEMLDEAYLHLSEIGMVKDVQKELSKFEDCINNYISGVDIVLAVHLVYLITPTAFKLLIDSLPVGKRMILVLDDDSSVFTKLWNKTAQKYVKRSDAVRSYLGEIGDCCVVNKTVITSRIINPLLQRPDIKEALLSLMCYSDYSLLDKDSKKYVDNCISENVSGRFINCTSACFEILKVK